MVRHQLHALGGEGGATCGRHKRTELQHAPVCNWSFVSASRTHRYGVTSLRFARALIRYSARGKACTTNDTLTNSVCNEQPPAHHNHEHAAQPAEAGSYVSAVWAVVGARQRTSRALQVWRQRDDSTRAAAVRAMVAGVRVRCADTVFSALPLRVCVSVPHSVSPQAHGASVACEHHLEHAQSLARAKTRRSTASHKHRYTAPVS